MPLLISGIASARTAQAGDQSGFCALTVVGSTSRTLSMRVKKESRLPAPPLTSGASSPASSSSAAARCAISAPPVADAPCGRGGAYAGGPPALAIVLRQHATHHWLLSRYAAVEAGSASGLGHDQAKVWCDQTAVHGGDIKGWQTVSHGP